MMKNCGCNGNGVGGAYGCRPNGNIGGAHGMNNCCGNGVGGMNTCCGNGVGGAMNNCGCGNMGNMGNCGCGGYRPDEPRGAHDFAYFTQTGGTYTPTPAGVPLTLTLSDKQIDSDITSSGAGILLPAGKYLVNYSFEGTASAADTLQIVPTLGGMQIATGARSDVQTTDDLQANMNGTFAVTVPTASTLGFNLVDPIAAAGTTVSNAQMAVTVEQMN